MSSSNRLWLTEAQARELAQHARADAPNEACGVLAGTDGVVSRVIPLRNAAAEPQTRYLLDPATLVRTWAEIENAGLSLIGFYHSHPRGDPVPSPTDIREATYPDAVYVIVGLRGETPQLAAWRVHSAEVERVELRIGAQELLENPDEGLSRAQKFAIIIGAVLALILMLILSLTLLPPAPIITIR
jgi:proteasome lid subunit RPN8/RPN11